MKILKNAVLALTLFSLLFFVACEKPNSFSHCEITLTLPDDFSRVDSAGPFVIYDGEGRATVFSLSSAEGADLTVASDFALVTLSRISKEAAFDEGIPPLLTQLEFAKFYKSLTDVTAEVYKNGDIPYYSYTRESNSGDEFFFLLSFYAVPNAYFVVSFITTADRGEGAFGEFLEYAEGVSFGS